MGKRIIVVTALVLGFVCPILAAEPDPNLMGYWKFEGDWLDSSGHNRTGVPTGNAQFGPGLDGQGLLLDGSGDYVTITGYKGILGGNPFSIVLWVKTTSTGDKTMVNWGVVHERPAGGFPPVPGPAEGRAWQRQPPGATRR